MHILRIYIHTPVQYVHTTSLVRKADTPLGEPWEEAEISARTGGQSFTGQRHIAGEGPLSRFPFPDEPAACL